MSVELEPYIVTFAAVEHNLMVWTAHDKELSVVEVFHAGWIISELFVITNNLVKKWVTYLWFINIIANLKYCKVKAC